MKKLLTITFIGLAIWGAVLTWPTSKPLDKKLGATVCTVPQGCTGTTTFAQNSFLFGNVLSAVGATSSPYFGNFTFTNATGSNATVTVINLPNVIASSTLASNINGDISYIPNGTANQIYGMNSGATGQIYRTVAAVANETTIAHSATQIAIGISDPLIGSKGGTGLSTVGINQLLFGNISNTWQQDSDLNYGVVAGNLGVGSTTPRFMVGVGGSLGATNAYLSSLTFAATSTINHNLVFGTASSTIYHAYLPTANATFGTTTLSGGASTVNTTAVRADSVFFLTIQSLGTVAVPTTVGVTARTAGTSFTITSANAVDTSVIGWTIWQPF